MITCHSKLFLVTNFIMIFVRRVLRCKVLCRISYASQIDIKRSKLVKKSKYVAFIDDDTIVRFDEFDSVFSEPIADEMICLRGNPIQHDNPTYHGKYHIWYDQERFRTSIG